MKFAHFSHVWNKTGMTPAGRYDQLWRELELADELGFDYGFCVEHHFRPDESWMSAPTLYAVAAAARTRRMRLGAMGYIVPLHHPLRLAEEIAIADQMMNGRLEVGLVPGIVPDFFAPYGVDFAPRREVTMEFVGLLQNIYPEDGAFSFEGRFHRYENLMLAVNPIQKPHPPLWLETRDPATLEFCAKNGLNTGYFIVLPRHVAAPRYRTFLAKWQAAGWKHQPNIAYSTVVYVDETDELALKRGLEHAAQAYRGIFPRGVEGVELREIQNRFAQHFEGRGEPEAAEVVRNLLDPNYLLEKDLILLGSPETVTRKLREWAVTGMFNTFLGEFNFSELPESDLMRSIELFGKFVIPELRGFDPF